MIRSTLTMHAKLLSIAIAGFTMLTACGNETQDAQLAGTDSDSMMELAIGDSDNLIEQLALDMNRTTGNANDTTGDANTISDANTCADIMATIHAHRKAVAETEAWKSFEATAQWQQVKADGAQLKRLKCKHNDENPSYACSQMIAKIKTDFAAAQATEAYKACTELAVWQELVKNYDEAREKQCLPSQRDDSEV